MIDEKRGNTSALTLNWSSDAAIHELRDVYASAMSSGLSRLRQRTRWRSKE